MPQLLRVADGLVAAVLPELAGSGRRRQELLERTAADAHRLGAAPALAARAEATVGTPRMPVLALAYAREYKRPVCMHVMIANKDICMYILENSTCMVI